VLAETSATAQLDGLVAYVFTSPGGADLDPAYSAALALAKRPGLPIPQQLAALRAVQLVAIEAKGLAEERRRELHALLAARFPSTDPRLNRELASMLAYAGQPGAVAEILSAFPKGETDQPQQIHYLYALRAVKDGWTRQDRVRALGMVERVAAWRGGASFPGFINLMFDQLIAGFSDEEKKLAYGKLPQFAPLSEEEIGAAAASAFARNRARAPANARTRGIRAISREEIVEEQIFTPQRQRPSLTAGRAAYDKICAQCHRFGSVGVEFGPDLSTLRSRFKKKDVLEAILWPNKAVSDQYETSEIETTDGNLVYGIVVSDDGKRLVVRQNQAERPVEVPKALVKERRRSALSLMPEGLVDELSQQELANLLAFLLTDPPQ
jgi:putative heme-binding domain-containing protein